MKAFTGPFRFIDLPPEIRNKIYRFALVRSRSLRITSEYHPKIHGQPTFVPDSRTAYYTREFARETTDRAMLTTYVISRNQNASYEYERSPLICGFLFINRQIRAEAASLFYGENNFRLSSTNAIIPFLQDLSTTSLELVKFLTLEFSLAEADIEVSQRRINRDHGYERRSYCSEPKDLATVCSLLGRFQGLKLEMMSVMINNWSGDPALTPFGKFNLGENMEAELKENKDRLWFYTLSESVTCLDRLGVVYNTSICLFGEPAPNANGNYFDDDWNNYTRHCYRVEKMIWDFLAPRMLEKRDDHHDPVALLARSMASQNLNLWIDLIEEKRSKRYYEELKVLLYKDPNYVVGEASWTPRCFV